MEKSRDNVKSISEDKLRLNSKVIYFLPLIDIMKEKTVGKRLEREGEISV